MRKYINLSVQSQQILLRIKIRDLKVLSTKKMKLLTHNMLTSKCLKGVTVGYPLNIEAQDVKICEVDFNLDFITRVISRIDYKVLYMAANALGHANEIPSELPDDHKTNNEFLKNLHHVLFEIEIIQGNLLCPETGRKFPINDGIPNMLLNEDEI